MIYKKLKQYVPEKFSLVWLGIFLAFVASAFSVTAYYFLYGFLETIIVEKNIEKAIPVSYKIVIFLIMNTVVYFLAVCATHVMALRFQTGSYRPRGQRKHSQAGYHHHLSAEV